MKSKPEAVKYRNNRINDDLYTPYNGIFPLLQYIPKYSTVWECCDYGKSKITELLKKDGHNVISTDIIHGFDFLKDEPNFYFDMIITNPPYSLKDDFIAKCYQYCRPFALLLPITALEGIRRGKLFKDGGISVIVLNKRLAFITGKRSNWFNTSWFTWGILPDNTLRFEEVESPQSIA